MTQDMFLGDVPILTYHQITPDTLPTPPGSLAISVSQFERQMRYLSDHGYQCLSLTELLRPPGHKRPWWEKTFALTFDDGYEDFGTQAYPLLRRYGFTATVFLVTDLVGKQSDWEGESGSPLLTWEQVKALHKDGISFGSHTCTHPRLPRLSAEQLRRELLASKARLEAELGQAILWLAYPYGEANRDIHRMAEAAGYQAACGLNAGRGGRFNLKRWLCRPVDNLPIFIRRLSWWSRYRRWLREETFLGHTIHKFRLRLFYYRMKEDQK